MVLAPPVHTPTQSITICAGNSIKIGTGVKNATYTWNTGATTDSITVNASGTYWVQTDLYGCSNRDSITVTVSPCIPVIAQFTTPDTVCVNTPVTITNNSSSNASSYYWTFCTGNLNTPPAGANLGVLNGAITSPVYIDYVQDNGNYYGFMTDNGTGRLFRLEFGTSLLNTPVTYNLGNFGGIIPNAAEGIQVIKNEGKWYAIIVGGTVANNTAPRILKIEFGTNIANNSPLATNWGNIGGLAYPHDLYVFPDNNGVWYGLTVNSDNSTITRFNFTNSFSNTPTAVNLGNIGALSGPTGIYAINDGGNWYAFVTNAVSSTLTRLDFGSSLLNTPTGTNLGNIGGLFHSVWDIQVIKYCGNLLAYVINADQSYNNILKLDFNNNITSTPTAVNFGNIGNMRFPHCLSKIFRTGSDLYTFVPNVANQTVTRISFAGCNNASLPNSTVPNPAPITYNTPGTYNINLTLDDGLPTQTAFCKQVVVLPEPTHTPTQAIDICIGASIKIGTGVKYAQYTWNTGATTDSIIVNTPGTYWVQTDRYGCSNRDSMVVKYAAIADFTSKQDVCNPLSVQFASVGNNLINPYWSFGDGNTTTGNLTTSHTYPAYGTYTVKFGVENGTCKDTITKNISINLTQSDLIYTPDTTICFNATAQLRAYPAFNFCWSPTAYLNNPSIPNPVTSTPGTITYYYTAEVPGTNLVTNGDFSNAATGFTSSYLYRLQNRNAGEFSVGYNPQSWSPWMGTCGDHTTGRGNMMLVNGSSVFNTVVWTQQINVTPNTNYVFSTWLQNTNNNTAFSNPPQLQFSINGKNTGNIMQGRNVACVWDQFYTAWNSGNNTTATIAIVNQNLANSYYALDDISFAPVLIQRDSVIVTVDTPLVKTINDTTICKNRPVPLQATGAATWLWSPATGLSDATISNPIARPLSNTQYVVTGTNVRGCSAKDTVQINLYPGPLVNLGPDITDCAINNLVLDAGNAGGQYLWQDGSLTQTFTANSFGKYYVQVTDAIGCENSDTINLIKTTARLGDFTFKIDACNPLSVQLTGAGANLQNPYWNFGDGNTITGNLNTSHTYSAYGNYTVQFGMESGYCKDTITHPILVQVTPANIIPTSDTTICFNTSKQLQATPSPNFCWSPTTYLNNPNIANPVTSTPQTITYYYTAEINGAILRDSVTISVDTPIVKTNNDTIICKDGFVQLRSTGAVTWSWLPVTGLSNTTINNPVAKPTANTDYIVTGTNINGCSAKDTVTIAIFPVPTVISNHDITACPNTPVQLAANAALTSWSWSPAGTLNNTAIANPVATPGVNTQYKVQVTDAHNCSYTDSVHVQLLFADFSITTMGGAICKGETINLKAIGGDSYLWSPAGSLNNAAISSPMATPDTSTVYSVHVTENTCNKDTTMKVMVAVNPRPTVAAEKTNDLDCIIHTTRLHATGTAGNSYLWSPVSGLDHPNSPNPVSTTDTTITYLVAATNQFGCVALDSVTVLVTSTGKVSFEVPNAFTPNGDGRNDCLGVKSWGGVELEEFSIFNRWGQRVFSSTKTNPCWDGRFNGEQQPSGGYVYVIRAKTYCGPVKRTGTVILER